MYEVEWRTQAQDELKEFWLAADSTLRRRLTRIAHELEEDLSVDPLACGESRGGGRRVVFAAR